MKGKCKCPQAETEFGMYKDANSRLAVSSQMTPGQGDQKRDLGVGSNIRPCRSLLALGKGLISLSVNAKASKSFQKQGNGVEVCVCVT